MNLAKMIGPRYIELAKLWAPTAITFTSAYGLAFLYYTDWKAVLQYVPIYGQKYSFEVPR